MAKSSIKIYTFVVFLISLCVSRQSIAAQSFKVDSQAFRSSLKDGKISDADVVVTINRFCNLGQTFLTENIFLSPKKDSFSRIESHSVLLPESLGLNELENIARLDDCVVSVSKNIRIELLEIPNDPALSKQKHLSKIQYDENFKFFFDNKIKDDSVIAIIDNGVDIHHEDLKQNLWINLKEKNGIPGIDDDGNGLIDDIYGYDFASKVGDPNHKIQSSNPIDSHGTHVAALAAAATDNSIGVAGVMAKHVKIMALNVFGKRSYGNLADLDTAIRYAADMGANVINISLGGKGSGSSTKSAIKYAVSKNSFVVVAAGNDGEVLSESNIFTPASFGAEIEGMITVGAIDISDSEGKLCSFSNRSSGYVELGAPGCNEASEEKGLYSAVGNNKYGYMAGTSMASPIAAGAALITYSYLRDQKNKKLSPAQLEEYLKQGSKSFPSLNSDIQGGKCVDLQSLKDKISLDEHN